MRRRSITLGLIVALATVGLGVGVAIAAINPNRDANQVAGAFTQSAPPGSVTGSEFTVIPPEGNPAAVSDSELATFPLEGGTFAMLSSGDATLADDPNSAGDTSTVNNGGNGGHGNVNDLVQLRVDLQVPQGANCLTLDFRFLSEEFPEFVGSQFNDAFIAELDQSSFQVGDDGSVSAPNNFAFDENNNVITINTTGAGPEGAAGTTYDGATPILRATTPITPGAHQIFLSVYDASDSIYDSTVFLDNLQLRNLPANQCQAGAVQAEQGKCQGKPATIVGNPGSQAILGTGERDVILGTAENDAIRGRGGNDLICGKGGNDEIQGNDGKDRILGNTGNDEVIGNAGADDVGGSNDNDKVFGRRDDDNVRGGKQNDKVYGNGGDDKVRGNQGNDRSHGGKGDDIVRGNAGQNRCFGGAGDDDLLKGC